jgi:signal transduction histidine kinase
LAAAAAATLLPFTVGWAPVPDALAAGVLASPPLATIGLSIAAVVGVRVVAAVGVPAIAASGVHLIGYNPFFDVGCVRICRDVRPVGDGQLTTHTAIVAFTVLGIAACAVGLGLTAARARQYTWMGFLVLGVSLGVRLVEPTAGLLLAPVAVALPAAGLGLDRLRLIRTRNAVSRLVRDLSGGLPSGLSGPDVRFAVPESDLWVGPDGRPIGRADGLIISDVAGPAIALGIPPRTDPAELAAGLSPGTRLALTNARLFAIARWRLGRLRASQRRVVAAADAERRRIERDLHDGAQQRLVSAALHLRVARPGTDGSAHPHLDAAEEQIRQALDALRQLAHGLVPASLVDEGLEAALRELAAGSVVPVELDVSVASLGMPDGAGGGEAALAAFTLAATAVGAAASATVAVVERDAELNVRIALEAAVSNLEERLSDAIDRIGAAGGEVAVDGDGPAVTIEAVIPCA